VESTEKVRRFNRNALRHENIFGAEARQLVVVNLEYNTVYDSYRTWKLSPAPRKLARTAGNQIAFTGSTRDDNALEKCIECTYGKCIAHYRSTSYQI